MQKISNEKDQLTGLSKNSRSYHPKDVMVSDQQLKNVGCFGSKGDIIAALLASGQGAEEVGGQNHGDVGHIHLVDIPELMDSLSEQ